MTVFITARIDEELAREIEEYMKDFKVDRSTAIKMILSMGIKDWKTQKALKLHSEGKTTLWKAAEMCDVSLREMIKKAAEKGITYQYNLSDLMEDIEAANSQ